MHLQHPKAIREVQVVQPSSQRRQLFLVVLVALYAIVGSWVYSTVGDPYALAVLEAERLDLVGGGEALAGQGGSGHLRKVCTVGKEVNVSK